MLHSPEPQSTSLFQLFPRADAIANLASKPDRKQPWRFTARDLDMAYFAVDRAPSYWSLVGYGNLGEEAMLRIRYPLLFAVVAMALISAAPSRSETIIDEWQNVKAPAAPKLQSVTLDPKTTALLVIDIIKQTCNMERRPRCVAMLPKVQKLLAEARAKGVFVIYALFPSPSPATFPNPKITDYVPELAPKGNEPVVTAFVDKFALADKDTGLEKMLKDKGIKNFIPVGVASHNGVLFSSVAAAFRGFNVVVPVDGMAGNNAYEDQLTAYTLTSSIVYKVTLTSIAMLKFE